MDSPGRRSSSFDGQPYSWGSNVNGQLGNNTTATSRVPVAVAAGAIPAGTTITRVAALGWGGMALSSTGQLYTWGYNSPGTLGNNTTPDSPVPVAVSQPSGTTFSKMASGVGAMHVLAVPGS